MLLLVVTTYVNRFVYLLVFILFVSCNPADNDILPTQVVGLRPIYASQQVGDIVSMPPRAFDYLGAILAVGDYILLVELSQGIHVVDNTNPEVPITLAFLVLPGASQITSDGDFLYASLINDLYVLDISDWQTVEIVEILEEVFDSDPLSLSPPPEYSGPFKCVEPALGNVVGWMEDLLESPRCRTSF